MGKVVGIDVGGTFTDLFLWDPEKGKTHVAKALSTVEDQSVGILNVLAELPVSLEELDLIVHGTTVATNALIERRGARCALITTKGFRDVIELKRRDRPTLYGLKHSFEPLIPRARRYEVEERVGADGRVLSEVSADEITALVRRLEEDRIQCAVIAFFNSYANPSNEQKAANILRSQWPGYVVVSTEVVPEYREFERISTAVTNAYVLPKVDSYLTSLSRKLTEKKFKGDVCIVHSGGGIVSLETARRFPVRTVVSGPSAGAAFAAHVGRAINRKNVISCDMGGTSFDACLIADGSFKLVGYKELGYGLPLLVPQIDMVTIGAGGGSIAWIDGRGLLQVGPQSAGATPGPACYGTGGEHPTVTDANLVLGRIDKERPIGRAGELILDVDLARATIERKIARPLGLTVEEAASAIIQVVNANMGGCLRLLSVARGHDPRDFALMAFGGAGPLHADALMAELDIAEVVIPRYPGLFCAVGAVAIPFKHVLAQTINKGTDGVALSEIRRVFSEQREQGLKLLEEKRGLIEQITVEYEAHMHYRRQTHLIRVPFSSLPSSKEELLQSFNLAYEKDRGALVEGVPVNIMNLGTIVTGLRPQIDLSRLAPLNTGSSVEGAREGTTRVYVKGAWKDCHVFDREKLPVGAVIRGPAIAVQADATTFVEVGSKAEVDDLGNLIIKRVGR